MKPAEIRISYTLFEMQVTIRLPKSETHEPLLLRTTSFLSNLLNLAFTQNEIDSGLV